MIKVLIFVVACFCGSAFAASVDVWKPGYVWDAAANTGVDVWYGPGNKVTTNGAFARGANVAASSGAFEIAETGSVLLRDGRAVALTATRVASVGALAMAAAKLASGPYGIIAVLALPTVYDWIMADNQQNIRVNLTRTGVEIKTSELTIVNFACGNIVTSGSIGGVADACAGEWQRQGRSQGYSSCVVTATVTAFNKFSTSSTGCSYYFNIIVPGSIVESWKPSTMDDISPYMTPRLPAQDYPKQIIDAGGEIDVTPKSITGPSPALVPIAPHVVTTQYPSPVDQVSTSQVAGNPFGLPANIPTQTGSSTGSASVSPGSSSTSGGPLPSGSASPVPQPITTPTTTTNISNYNPTTNITTTTSTTHADPQTQVSTTTNVTNITNTTNSSTVTNSTTTVTNTANNTTNVTNTKTDSTPVNSQPAPEPAKDPCEANPDRVGCMKLDDVPTDKVPTKTVTITWAEENLGLGAGSCPAPTPLHTSLGDYSLDLTQYCGAITFYVRPLVLLFSLLAAFFIVAPVKET